MYHPWCQSEEDNQLVSAVDLPMTSAMHKGTQRTRTKCNTTWLRHPRCPVVGTASTECTTQQGKRTGVYSAASFRQ